MSNWLDRWLAPAPAKARVAWLRGVTYAHRGLHGAGIPENSPAAFGAAIAAGLGIECDVQETADGEALVFHDWTLERMTGESGAVAERTLDELRRVRFSAGTDSLPSLSDLLDQIGGKVPLLIELKMTRERRVAPLCRAVRRTLESYAGECAVMSFDPRVSRWFALHAPDVVRGLVVTEREARHAAGGRGRRWAMWHARPQFLAYDIRDLRSSFAAQQRRRGLPLLTWTVQNKVQRERAGRRADGWICEGEGLATPV